MNNFSKYIYTYIHFLIYIYTYIHRYIYIYIHIYAKIVLPGFVPYFFIFLTYCVRFLAHPSPILVHAPSLCAPYNTYISATMSNSLR